MSNKHRPRLSLKGEQNALTTEPTQPAQVEISVHTQEKSMEASQEKNTQEAPVATELTAKQMAAAEEANAVRSQKLVEQQQAPPPAPAVPIADVAARGYDALHEAFRRHNENSKPKEYVPPPRTPRQMAALEEELEAGRRSQAKAQAQFDTRPVPKVEASKEGFTTPVYRPGESVPDPVTGKLGSFSPDV
jgi:hypothetical protein